MSKNLLADEQIIARTGKHLIIFLFPSVWLVLGGFLAHYMQDNLLLQKLAWTPWLVTLILWLQVGLQYYTADFTLTNKRLLLREGLFYQHRNETRLASIANIQVEQSLLGAWLNYGTIIVYSFGMPDAFYLIKDPSSFQQQVAQQLDRAVS